MAPESQQSRHQALVDWIKGLEGRIAYEVEIGIDPLKGQCLRVRDNAPNNLPSGRCAATCPIQATMSIMNIDNSIQGVPLHGFVCSPDFFDATEGVSALAFFLMDQYLLGDESFWAPYIQSLPDMGEITRLEHYSDEDLKWLEGTNLSKIRENSLRKLKQQYEAGLRLLQEYPNRNTQYYSWPRFLWASSIIISRAFTSEVLKDCFASMEQPPPQKDFSVLVPLLDMTNHQPLAPVEWRTTPDGVSLIVHKTLIPGEEVPNNYGPRNNERLMVNYGFCLPGNVCDYRELALNPPPGTPLYIAKERRHELFPEKSMEDKYYIYNIFYPLPPHVQTFETSIFSRDLLDAAGVMSISSPRGIADLVVAEDRIYIRLDKYGNSRYLLSALGHIIKALVHSIITLKTRICFREEPQNAKQKSAKQYREAQIYLAECAIAMAEWTLTRARYLEGVSPELFSCLDSILQDLSEERFDRRHRDRIRVLINERPSELKYCGELFKNDQVSEALSESAKMPFQNFITRAVNLEGANESNGRMIQSMAVYTLFICFCAGAYRNLDEHERLPDDHPRCILPARLQKWTKFLFEHYPVPSTDVRWVLQDDTLEDGLKTLEEDLINGEQAAGNARVSHLEPLTRRWMARDRKGWYRGNWLRWAWLTAEKEAVGLLNDPLSFLSEEEITPEHLGITLEKLFGEDLHLYIPCDIEDQDN